MNLELQQHLMSVRKVLVEQFPRQCREGAVNPSEWIGIHNAAEWLADNTYLLSGNEARGFNDLLLWVQSSVNEMFVWMREQIETGKTRDDTATNELRARFEKLWADYDERARDLLNGSREAQNSSNMRQEYPITRPIEDRPIQIFFSYAHEDEALMDEVRIQLIAHERIGDIIKWHDRMIPPGEDWQHEIDHRIEQAHVILLFMSPAFIASRYCFEIEGEVALRRHQERSARVIPVVLRACNWNVTPFGDLQALPTDGIPFTQWPDRDQASLDIAQGIMRNVL